MVDVTGLTQPADEAAARGFKPNWNENDRVQLIWGNYIKRKAQPREEFDVDEFFDQNIKKHGINHPLRICRGNDDSECILIGGERRFRSALSAGWRVFPCFLVVGEVSEGQLYLDQIQDNRFRRSLNPMEEARSYRRAMELNEGMDEKALALELDIDLQLLRNSLSLLSLPDSIQGELQGRRITKSVGILIAQAPSVEKQEQLAVDFISGRRSESEIKTAVRMLKPASSNGRGRPARGQRREFKGMFDSKITIESPRPITLEQATQMFQSILDQWQ